MNNPVVYSNTNILPRRDAKYVIDNYFKYIIWLPNGGDVSMDIGCGDGRVTRDILLNNIPNSIETIVATDISSKMIEYATINYQHSKLRYQQLDMDVKTLPQQFIGKFDHVFSFYCLNWIQDQRTLFQNIYDLLKPNGDVLVAYLASHPLFSLWETISKFDKWKSYMTDCNLRVSPYHHCSNTEEVHKKILKDTGFDVKICKLEKRTFVFTDMSWRETMEGVDPFIQRIPESSRKEYMDDYVVESKKSPELILEDNTVDAPYKLLIVYAQKRV